LEVLAPFALSVRTITMTKRRKTRIGDEKV
jgi:hypothetical protein